MKAILILVFIMTPVLPAQTPNQSHESQVLAWLKFVASELVAVRRELHEERMAKQQEKVETLEREFEQVRAERREGEDQARMQSQELARIEQNLLAPTLTPEEKTQLEGVRAELLARKPSAPANAGRVEAQAVERLRQEQSRLQAMRQQAQALASRQ
jgi:hypothetical protein